MSRDDGRSSPARSPLWTAALIAALYSWTVTAAQAQETGWIRVNLGTGGESGSFMISCIHEGEVVFQTEGDWGSGPYCRIGGSTDIPVGVYDVRVEGDGMVTQVKRGILVTAGNENSLRFVMELGEGVHTVEYSTGALSREEVAVRLRALEAARTETDDRLTALEEKVAELIGRDNQ